MAEPMCSFLTTVIQSKRRHFSYRLHTILFKEHIFLTGNNAPYHRDHVKYYECLLFQGLKIGILNEQQYAVTNGIAYTRYIPTNGI